MIETLIKWYNVNDEKPSKSGDYMVFVPMTDGGYISVMHYSAKYKEFNAFDCLENADNAINVKYWAQLPDVEETFNVCNNND